MELTPNAVSLVLSTMVGKGMMSRQKVYQEATQERINFTSSVLGSIKSVKMLGFTEHFTALIESKRIQDLRMGNRFREMSLYSNCIGMLQSSVNLRSRSLGKADSMQAIAIST